MAEAGATEARQLSGASPAAGRLVTAVAYPLGACEASEWLATKGAARGGGSCWRRAVCYRNPPLGDGVLDLRPTAVRSRARRVRVAWCPFACPGGSAPSPR